MPAPEPIRLKAAADRNPLYNAKEPAAQAQGSTERSTCKPHVGRVRQPGVRGCGRAHSNKPVAQGSPGTPYRTLTVRDHPSMRNRRPSTAATPPPSLPHPARPASDPHMHPHPPSPAAKPRKPLCICSDRQDTERCTSA
jgi:hypothetical protein